MKIALAGTGAMGVIHMKALQKIDGVEVVSIASRTEESGKAFADEWKIPFHSTSLEAVHRPAGRGRRDPDHAERAARGSNRSGAVERQARPGRNPDGAEPARFRAHAGGGEEGRQDLHGHAHAPLLAARIARSSAASRKARSTSITWWSRPTSSGAPISTCTGSRDRGWTTCSGTTAATRSTSRSGWWTIRTGRSGARRDRTTKNWASRWTSPSP